MTCWLCDMFISDKLALKLTLVFTSLCVSRSVGPPSHSEPERELVFLSVPTSAFLPVPFSPPGRKPVSSHPEQSCLLLMCPMCLLPEQFCPTSPQCPGHPPLKTLPCYLFSPLKGLSWTVIRLHLIYNDQHISIFIEIYKDFYSATEDILANYR